MDRDEEYEKVFGEKPKKPKKPKTQKKLATTKKAAEETAKTEPVPVEEPGPWAYDGRKPEVGDKKAEKNIRFLIGLAVVFAVLLVIGWLVSLFQGSSEPAVERGPESSAERESESSEPEPEPEATGFDKNQYDVFIYKRDGMCEAVRPECGICMYRTEGDSAWKDGIIEGEFCYLPKDRQNNQQ